MVLEILEYLVIWGGGIHSTFEEVIQPPCQVCEYLFANDIPVVFPVCLHSLAKRTNVTLGKSIMPPQEEIASICLTSRSFRSTSRAKRSAIAVLPDIVS